MSTIPTAEFLALLEGAQLLTILIRLDRVAATCRRTGLTPPPWLEPTRKAVEARFAAALGDPPANDPTASPWRYDEASDLWERPVNGHSRAMEALVLARNGTTLWTVYDPTGAEELASGSLRVEDTGKGRAAADEALRKLGRLPTDPPGAA